MTFLGDIGIVFLLSSAVVLALQQLVEANESVEEISRAEEDRCFRTYDQPNDSEAAPYLLLPAVCNGCHTWCGWGEGYE